MATFNNTDGFSILSSSVGAVTEKPKTSEKPRVVKPKNRDPKEEKRKEEFEKSVEERICSEKRAHQTVLLLIEDHVSTKVLQDAARYIDPNYYKDIVTERAIDRLCGYPICDQRLSTKLSSQNQLYRIDASAKTVYEIFERKSFCSNRCYAASVLYQKQLPTTPVWLRGGEKPEEVNVLMPSEVRGIQGAFVNLIDRDPVHDIAAEVKAMNLRDAAEEAKASRKSSLKSANEEKGKEEWSNGESGEKLVSIKESDGRIPADIKGPAHP